MSASHLWMVFAAAFVSTRAKLAQSRTAAAAKVQRAQILLRYSQGETVSAIATVLRTNRPKIER